MEQNHQRLSNPTLSGAEVPNLCQGQGHLSQGGDQINQSDESNCQPHQGEETYVGGSMGQKRRGL